MSNYAVFDFCETMIKFQSADAFVHYVTSHHQHSLRICFIEFLRKVLLKTKIIDLLQRFTSEGSINKRILLYEIKGIDKYTLKAYAKDYYEEMIAPNYIVEVLDVLKDYQEQGWITCILSGGYDVYLRYVQNNLHINYLICTNLEYKNGKSLGRYIGKDCIGENKKKMFIDYFGSDVFQNGKVVFISDSESDLPMFESCSSGIVVCKDNVPEWSNKQNLEVLIWQP